MCVIAGYCGNRQAAPILVEMLKRGQFFDGGKATGIVTIHEGKLYSAKVIGDVDEFLRNYNVEDFPGTCGLIHSRPAANNVEHAHPFISHDGKCGLVGNGTQGVGVFPPVFLAEFIVGVPDEIEQGDIVAIKAGFGQHTDGLLGAVFGCQHMGLGGQQHSNSLISVFLG